jgi:hypothetical protein
MIETIIIEDKTYTFIDFLELTEGISPKKTEYEFTKSGDTLYGKFRSSDGLFVCVVSPTVRPGWYEIGFGRHKDGRPTEPDPRNYTMTEQLPTQKFFDVFGRVLFVILDMVKKLPETERLRFSGGYRAIADFYRVLMNNNMFVNKIRDLGFELDSEMMEKYGSGIFILKKVSTSERN